MFNKAGIPFEDNRVTGDAWMELKPTLEFGQVPCIEVNGTKMYQSIALYNYVAGVSGIQKNKWQWHKWVTEIQDNKHEQMRKLRMLNIPNV